MYLWIDLWDKRCWIALEIEWVVMPKDIVLRPKLVSYLKKIIQEYNIKIIVVWLPYDLYGKELKQLNKTKEFIKKLKNIFPNIKIEGVDERFTSFQAEQTLDEMWVKDKEWKKDDISAALILESYIKQKH
jgi:putative Holliday junction resolvase